MAHGHWCVLLVAALVGGLCVPALAAPATITPPPAMAPWLMRHPRPVVVWHGLGDAAHSDWMERTKQALEAMHPGLFVYVVALQPGVWSDRRASFWGHVPTQVEQVHAQLQGVPELQHGFDAVGFSQGGQFLRAYVERFNDPPVRRLLTFGSQHMGITDLPACGPHDPVCHSVHSALATHVYSDYAQRHIVTAQYFRDTRTPEQFAQYHAKNSFLHDINNEGAHKNATYKAHMLQLDSFVMVQFTDDATVIPSNSSWFEAFPDPEPDAPPALTTVPLRESQLYRDDWIGLRELDRRGALVFRTCAGAHMHLSDECRAATWGRFLGPPPLRDELRRALPRFPLVYVLVVCIVVYVRLRFTRRVQLP